MGWPEASDLEGYLQQTFGDASYESGSVEFVLDLVKSVVIDVVGDFAAATGATIEVDGYGGDTLVLPVRPVSTVTSVTISGTVLDPSTYRLNSGAGTLTRLDGPWPYGRNAVEIVCNHGQDVPGAVRLVVLRSASRMLRSPEQRTVEGYEGFSGSYPDASQILTSQEMEALFRVRGPILL